MEKYGLTPSSNQPPMNLTQVAKMYLEVQKLPDKVRLTLFQKILVPLDGSEQSKLALEKAIQIAKKLHGKITLIHVFSDSTFAITPVSTQKYKEFMSSNYVQAMRDYAESFLSDGKKKAEAEGIQVETLMVDGHVVEEILKTARDGDFSLIVIGSRGLSTIKELLMGSVSDGVTKHALCPVLVV
jgi:nucleotide-binding universal stress UspA family protein